MSKRYAKNIALFLAGLHATNSLIDFHTSSLERTQNIVGLKYNWRHGDIFFRKKGKGSPILLIHNVDHMVSSYEWDKILYNLSKKHTVYTIDLPGCGRSDKPKFIYTNYLFVQLIKDFIKDVIKEKPIVITSKDSCSFIVMVNHMVPDIIKKIIMINPPILSEKRAETNSLKLGYMKLLSLPVIGTSIYNVQNLSSMIFLTSLVHIPLSEETVEHSTNMYIASHYNQSNGKFLYASKLNGFLNIGYSGSLENKENISIIISKQKENTDSIIKSYLAHNPNIEIIEINSDSNYPCIDNPSLSLSAIEDIID